MRNPNYVPGEYYHLYNRANGGEKMFFTNANYQYFLRCYQEKIAPYFSTLAYCLMPNHFHFVIKVKSSGNFLSLHPRMVEIRTNDAFADIISNEILRRQQGWIGGYAQAINKQENRRGNLFIHTSKRKRLHDQAYLQKLIVYVHQNPLKAGLVQNLGDWVYNSFREIYKDTGIIDYKEIIEIFDGNENFQSRHEEKLRHVLQSTF